MTELVGGYGTKTGAAKNPWLLHLSAFRKANPSVKNALQEAKKTYKKGGAPNPSSQKSSDLERQQYNNYQSLHTNPKKGFPSWQKESTKFAKTVIALKSGDLNKEKKAQISYDKFVKKYGKFVSNL